LSISSFGIVSISPGESPSSSLLSESEFEPLTVTAIITIKDQFIAPLSKLKYY
jgi:hypothetical protein